VKITKYNGAVKNPNAIAALIAAFQILNQRGFLQCCYQLGEIGRFKYHG